MDRRGGCYTGRRERVCKPLSTESKSAMNSTQPKLPGAVLTRIAALPKMSLSKLNAEWRSLFEHDPPLTHRRFLERRIAYRLQELEWENTHGALLAENRARVAAFVEQGSLPPRVRNGKPMPGTILVRHFGGEDHQVTVTAEGDFDYRGQLFGSLSAIAKRITGTQWSGPKFFGLPTGGKRKETSR